MKNLPDWCFSVWRLLPTDGLYRKNLFFWRKWLFGFKYVPIYGRIFCWKLAGHLSIINGEEFICGARLFGDIDSWLIGLAVYRILPCEPSDKWLWNPIWGERLIPGISSCLLSGTTGTSNHSTCWELWSFLEFRCRFQFTAMIAVNRFFNWGQFSRWILSLYITFCLIPPLVIEFFPKLIVSSQTFDPFFAFSDSWDD